ncbi:MAG TPA: CapA family protein [Gemmatimonadales bacterium]|nr:CapA family protein [Gemmatimonadales bacterium]
MIRLWALGSWLGALTFGAPSLMHAQDSTPPSPALIEAHARLLADSTQRPSAAAPQRPSTRLPAYPPIRLAFTGDINLGTSLLPGGVPSDTAPSPFARVDSLLRGDLVIGTFEGAFSDTLPAAKCGGMSNCYEFRTPRWMVRRLVEAGFTHLNLANNHASDLGEAGRLETRQVLDSAQLQHYGILGEIALDSVQGLLCENGACAPLLDRWTRVALIGFSTYDFAYDLLQVERAKVVVDSMSRLADVVIVTFHGGTEGKKAVRVGTGMERMGGERRGDLRKFTHAVIDAGADAVVGHGPHVLRGIEFYRGRPIAYSMGNFVTWHGFNMTGVNALTGVLQLELNTDGSFAAGRFVPLRQLKWVGAVPDRSRAALAQVRRLTRLDFPRTGAVIANDGTFKAPDPRPQISPRRTPRPTRP